MSAATPRPIAIRQLTPSNPYEDQEDTVVFSLHNPIEDMDPTGSTLWTYCDVTAERTANVETVRGNITTHLDLQDWCEMKGFRLKHFERRDMAVDGERTWLVPISRATVGEATIRRERVGTETVRGMPAVKAPIPSKTTLLGIPLPSFIANAIKPSPIKIIG